MVKKYARVKYYYFSANYHENNNFNRPTKDNFRFHNTITILPKDKKIESDLGRNPNKGRHMPRKNKDQDGNEKSRIKYLEIKNQVLRSRLSKSRKVISSVDLMRLA